MIETNIFAPYSKRQPYTQLFYITEVRGWATKQIGQYLVSNLPPQVQAVSTYHFKNIKHQVIHFGAKQQYLLWENWKKLHPSNKVVLTWYHGRNSAYMTLSLIRAASRISFIHTSCSISRDFLIKRYIPEEKIVKIPLGVDLNIFRPADAGFDSYHKDVRKKLEIPLDARIIGSFQKDGNGWRKGFVPKLIKGPDILVATLEKLNKEYPIFVLLSGPSRGYVMKELDKRQIPYKHFYPKTLNELAILYHALDVYLITSREEGGPLSLLESMASSVPVVSTRVGMAPDIIQNGHNGYLADIENVNELTSGVSKLLNDPELRMLIATNALQNIDQYSWKNIAQQHYKKMYSKLLEVKKYVS